MKRKSVGDVSSFSFLLLEATGDSEIDCDPTPLQEVGDDPRDWSSIPVDDKDDAESCSYGSSRSRREDSDAIVGDGRDADGEAEGKRGGTEEMVVNKEEDYVHSEARSHGKRDDGDDRQRRQNSTAAVDSIEIWNRIHRRRRSTVSVDSPDQDLGNDIEQNRLFWEACLAS